VIAQRILAILSATLLVGAVAVVLLGPPGMPFGQALLTIDHRMLDTIQAALVRVDMSWLWMNVILPILVRPAWLPPVGLGLICAGLSLTVPVGRRAERSRHRRS
jgi:hypothetical protein